MAVSQKTSMERAKQRQEEEEQKRMDREREIRAEEEKKRMDLDKKIRQEEEEKRQVMLEEVKAQCSGGQIVSISSISFGFILSVLLVNHLMDY